MKVLAKEIEMIAWF